jgi:hypothetical protein
MNESTYTFLISSRNVDLYFNKKRKKKQLILQKLWIIKETKYIPKQPKEEFKTHTLNPLDEDEPSILIGLLDSMEPEKIWINT